MSESSKQKSVWAAADRNRFLFPQTEIQDPRAPGQKICIAKYSDLIEAEAHFWEGALFLFENRVFFCFCER